MRPISDPRRTYPAGGWLPVGAHLDLQRSDQGRDLVTDWRGVVQAPGRGTCTRVGSDAPFPSGFGPSYPYVRIDSGRFAGHEFYLGHTSSLVRAGDRFSFGHPLSRADQGHDFEGTRGGWVELGEAFGGLPGPNRPSHWFDRLLSPLVVGAPVIELSVGDRGVLVRILSARLRILGLMRWRSDVFGRRVHHAVVRFQREHGLGVDGDVDDRTWLAIKHAAEREVRTR